MPEEPKLIRKLKDLDGYEDTKYKIRIVTGTNDLRVSHVGDDPYAAVLNIDIAIFDLKIIVAMLNLIGLNFEYVALPKFSEADILFAKSYTMAGYGEWWLAKDNGGSVYMYEDLPVRNAVVWMGSIHRGIIPQLFKSVSFQTEPIQLKTIAESEVEK